MKKIRPVIVAGTVLGLSALGIAASPWTASSDDAGHGKASFGHHRMMHARAGGAPIISMALKLKSELNLSDAQIGDLEKIRTHYQDQIAPLRELLRANRREIATLMQDSPTNLIQVKSKIQEAEKTRSELQYLRLEAITNGKSVLTAEQQLQLKELLAARHEQFKQRHGRQS